MTTEYPSTACDPNNPCDDCPGDCAQPQAKPAFYTVAIYLCDRAFGGREEGGWWYDTGTRVDDLTVTGHGNIAVPKIFTDHNAACEYCRVQNLQLDYLVNNDGANRDLSSVCCVGRYCAEVHDGYPPEHYPTHRPHYE